MKIIICGFLLLLLGSGCNKSQVNMENMSENIWFEGSNEIKCDIQQVKNTLDNLGEHYVGVISVMPGLSSVELVEQGSDFVTIKTNEGLMKRTNISMRTEADRIVIEFDEEYQAGQMVTTKSHFIDEFTANNSEIMHRIVISNVKAPGLMGFFYRNFGSSKMGNAFLNSYKTYLEK